MVCETTNGKQPLSEGPCHLSRASTIHRIPLRSLSRALSGVVHSLVGETMRMERHSILMPENLSII